MARRAFGLAAVVATTLGVLSLAGGGSGADPKGPPPKPTTVTVRDYEKAAERPKVWVVNIPDANAAVALSTDHPHEGKQCLKLHYHFVDKGDFQYLGVPNAVRIRAPVHKLRYMLHGDGSKCSYGVQLTDAGGETHQYSANTGQGGVVDFKGWKEVVVDLDSGHETWGGDKNGKLDYPLTAVTFTVGQPRAGGKKVAAEGDLYFDALTVDAEGDADETLGCQIAVTDPEYCSTVKGDTRIAVAAPGFRALTVRCWKAGPGPGTDSTVAEVKLDARGSFTFPADDYPHGPVVLRLSGAGRFAADNCYLQLYNRGGASWNEGLPKDPPPAAKGMNLLFADDFKGPLSISSTDPKATYYDHKPPSGFQDFSHHTFAGFDSPKNPFAQVDTYLRIRAGDEKHSAGLISSVKNDGRGIKAAAPCYFECRFLGPNAPGTWPGFWLMTDYMTGYDKLKEKTPCDELDILEAYGGEGPGSPSAFDAYMVTPHCWNQGDAGKRLEDAAFKAMRNPIRMKKFGIKSTWYEAFHTYGCRVTETDTVYYCDDVEVGRHATFPLSKKQPLFFMVNLATGGGWPVDLSRYGGRADMYVDYVRVYAKAP
jgi:hypothetical protein